MSAPLDCGHAATPQGGAAGYARRQDGTTLCYPCADAEELAAMAQSDTFVAYVASDGREITTRSGGTLARVAGSGIGRAGFGVRVHYWAAESADGRLWYGRSAGPGMAVILRARKSSRVTS